MHLLCSIQIILIGGGCSTHAGCQQLLSLLLLEAVFFNRLLLTAMLSLPVQVLVIQTFTYGPAGIA